VLDSRIGWHFLPDAIRIFVRVDIREASRRIFRSKRGIEKENLSYSKTLSNTRRRIQSEALRYKKYYGIDVNDLSNYDIVIDTTGMSIGKMNRVVELAVGQLLM
jgi:cytidylate kinase